MHRERREIDTITIGSAWSAGQESGYRRGLVAGQKMAERTAGTAGQEVAR